jgi:dihydropteroate synthase-like protein
MPYEGERIHLITGKLAEPAVRSIVDALSRELGFHYVVECLPITVAALMTSKWLLRQWQPPEGATRVLLPGYLADQLDAVRAQWRIPVDCGPKDIRDLPSYFGMKPRRGEDYGQYSIEILAEINHAPRLSTKELLKEARQLREDGADVIDLGCSPGERWRDVAASVRCLREEGMRVSIDTFDPWEAGEATKAGACLVLSVNQTNRQAAVDWGCEVVIVPDDVKAGLDSLSETAQFLESRGVRFRLDPVLEPIGCGFAASLQRYHQARQRWPEAAMMMGIGNLTELTDCDSAGINTLLLGYCAELRIDSVLTTQVINWAKTSARECDLARRLVHYSVTMGIPPKHLEPRLVMLRDPEVHQYPAGTIDHLARSIKDNNYRILVDASEIHLFSAGVHLRGTDPFELMERLMAFPQSKGLDPSHAFYLGFELSKALTALTLGKQYEQDEALNWGMHTRPETHHRLARKKTGPRIT